MVDWLLSLGDEGFATIARTRVDGNCLRMSCRSKRSSLEADYYGFIMF